MAIITQDMLTQLFGYSKPADLAICLEKNKIKYFTGKRGQLSTTETALNHALGLPVQPVTYLQPQENKRQIDFG